MKKLFILSFSVFVFYSPKVFSQNLVPNSSFENVSAEPFWGCELTNANGWLNPSGSPCPNNGAGTPDLYSTLSTGQAILPNTFMGTTNAHTGNRCAGLVTYHQQLSEYREYITSQLSCRMDSGVAYSVSFWTTGGNPVQYVYHSNNIGIYFSIGALTQNGYNVIPGITPQLELTTLIANSAWTYYTFNYTPSQAYSYMTIGNFRNDANTQTQSFGTNRPYAYYFFDDIYVVPVGGTTISLGNDTSYCGSFSRTLSTGDPNTLWSTGVTASQITVTTTGTYWASVGTGCTLSSDTIVITQTSSPPLPFNIGNDTTYCGFFIRTLSTGNSSTLWSTGVTASQINVNATGTYWAQITNGCGSTSDTIMIAQNTSPLVNLGNDTTLCIGQSLLLNAGNASATYLWQDNSNAASYNVSSTGNYSVIVTNASGCSASDNIAITYTSSPPVLNLGNDTSYCGSFSRTLSTGNANTLWNTGVTAAQITVTTGETFWASVSNGCGSVRDTIIISQHLTPAINLGNDTTLCSGQSLTLDATSAGATYLWQDNSTQPTFNVTGVGIYTVTVTNATGCAAIGRIMVSYNTQAPLVNLGPDIEVCGNSGVVLNTHIANANYLWSDNSTDSLLTVSTTGTYSVTVSTGCGSASDAVSIQIHADECALLIPTAFSPNADGANDLFRAISRCPVKRFALHIHNRWGELVFETTDAEEGWNGVFRDMAQPLGVYVYYIDYFNYCEQKMKKVVGNVTLVR